MYGCIYLRSRMCACRYVVFRVPRIKAVKEEAKRSIHAVVHGKKYNPGSYPDYVDTAHPIMISLTADLWKGGKAAGKQVAAMIAAALAPHRKPDSPNKPPDQGMELIRYSNCA